MIEMHRTRIKINKTPIKIHYTEIWSLHGKYFISNKLRQWKQNYRTQKLYLYIILNIK